MAQTMPSFDNWVWDDQETKDLVTHISESAAQVVMKELFDDPLILIDKDGDVWNLTFSAMGGDLIIKRPLVEEISVWAEPDYADDSERLELAVMLRQLADRIEAGKG